MAPDEDERVYERAARLTKDAGTWPDVAQRLDAANAFRALIWPVAFGCLAVTALLVIRPGVGPIAILAILVVLNILATPTYYYCYISSRKLDQLVGTPDVESAATATGEEGAQYGPPGLRLRADAGRQTVARLQLAIRKLESQSGGLPDLTQAIQADDHLEPGAYRQLAMVDRKSATIIGSPQGMTSRSRDHAVGGREVVTECQICRDGGGNGSRPGGSPPDCAMAAAAS